MLELRIDELEKENAYLRKMLRYSQSENLERLYFENNVLKERITKYEELEKQGLITLPANEKGIKEEQSDD